MKKLMKKVILAIVGLLVLALTGICAYAGIVGLLGMQQEHGEEAGTTLFKKYVACGKRYLKNL